MSLIVPGTGPREQLALLDYFLRMRTRPARALVFGLDGPWCTDDSALPIEHPFPFWLYDSDPLTFVTGLVRYSTLEHVAKSVELALGRTAKARPNGYWNYAQDRPWFTGPSRDRLEDQLDTTPHNDTGRFPALDRFSDRLAKLPRETAVVLVRPPVYITSLPRPGSALQRSEADCLAATRRLLAVRSRTALLNFRVDRPEAHDAENWFDHTHYREPVARLLEGAIAAAVHDLDSRR